MAEIVTLGYTYSFSFNTNVYIAFDSLTYVAIRRQSTSPLYSHLSGLDLVISVGYTLESIEMLSCIT